MAKKRPKYKATPHDVWLADLSKAWKALPEERGADSTKPTKASVLKASGVSSSTRSRIDNEIAKVGYDSLEALRIAINEKTGTKLPPPALAMRSPLHYEWSKQGLDLDEDGGLGAIQEWAVLGARLRDLQPELFESLRDELAAAVEAAERGKQSSEDLEQSRDGFARASASLRNVGSATSDRPGKTGHGTRSSR